MNRDVRLSNVLACPKPSDRARRNHDALGGCEAQVLAHVKANLRVGNDRQHLIDVLTQLLPFIGYPRMPNALRALNEATAPASSDA